jgi:hypothetical protein
MLLTWLALDGRLNGRGLTTSARSRSVQHMPSEQAQRGGEGEARYPA